MEREWHTPEFESRARTVTKSVTEQEDAMPKNDHRVKVTYLGGDEYYWKWFVQYSTEDDNLAYEYSGNWDTWQQAMDHANWIVAQQKRILVLLAERYHGLSDRPCLDAETTLEDWVETFGEEFQSRVKEAVR